MSDKMEELSFCVNGCFEVKNTFYFDDVKFKTKIDFNEAIEHINNMNENTIFDRMDYLFDTNNNITGYTPTIKDKHIIEQHFEEFVKKIKNRKIESEDGLLFKNCLIKKSNTKTVLRDNSIPTVKYTLYTLAALLAMFKIYRMYKRS